MIVASLKIKEKEVDKSSSLTSYFSDESVKVHGN